MANWNQGAQGALGGAAAGAAFGPWGAGIGAAIGGLGGLFGGGGSDVSEYQEMLKQLAAGYGRRTAPQAGPAAQAANSQFRGNQQKLIAFQEAQMRGEGPSAAQNLMLAATDRTRAGMAAEARSAGGRGVNAGAAMRNAMNTGAGLQAQANQDIGTIRAQEQLAAAQQLGGNLNSARGFDQQTSQFNAGAMNQMAQANLEAKLRTLGLNDQAQLQALMAAMGGEASKGPGLGSQILAGGAMAMPGLMQWQQQQKMMGGGGGAAAMGNIGGGINNVWGQLGGLFGGPGMPQPDPWA